LRRGPLRDEALRAAFDDGAAAYDAMVGLNPGYHEHLRLSARRLALLGDGAGLRLLDVGCGTGASTAALLSVAPTARVVAVDAAGEMLTQARRKVWPASVRFLHSPVEGLAGVLAAAEEDDPFDAVFAAYLVRNLSDPDGQLRALRDLLRPGGTLAVHDYVVGESRFARLRWTGVCWGVVIPLAVAHRGGVGLYRHLWRSVIDFDDAPGLARRLLAAGFVDVRYATMPGWQHGIEHTFLATRPVAPQPRERSA
jgi:ubiquinone/menaquinone biosynthesis C-methylase UbiE